MSKQNKNIMTQEDKELLFKDLCARWPYGVKVNNEIQGDFEIYGVCENYIFARTSTSHVDFQIEKIKPYLFPMSSMTDKQKEEYDILRDSVPTYHYEFGDVMVDDTKLCDNWESIDYLNAHHFDYRGLIEKGLAIDATNLNIY